MTTIPPSTNEPSPSLPSNNVSSLSSSSLGTKTTTTTTTNNNTTNNIKDLQIVFIHLDWGIGGAEQLMLQLCHATNTLQRPDDDENTTNSTKQNRTTTTTNYNPNLHLITCYCSPDHCFESLHPTTGIFYHNLYIWGSYIPSTIFYNKYGKAMMSHIRLLYIAYCIIHHPKISQANIIVLDVLPTPLLVLRYFLYPTTSFIFYCHYPDQLLVQSSSSSSLSTIRTITQWMKQSYRYILNTIEEQCMLFADMIVVNSKFTQQTVLRTFTSLQQQQYTLPILYPALEIHHNNDTTNTTNTNTTFHKQSNLIVSLNRFERKKNLQLLIEAIAWIQQHDTKYTTNTVSSLSSNTTTNNNNPQPTMHVVIAGGYDPLNIENIEYHQELLVLAQQLHVTIDFQFSITDQQRTQLLHTATMVIYTPINEHFGIVPLEAMYAKTPVIACNSGGPIETIVHDVTGFLCEPTSISFGTAIYHLLQHPNRAIQMGIAGHDHVIQHFSPIILQHHWEQLLHETIQITKSRCQQQQEQQQRRHYFSSLLYSWILPRYILFGFEIMIIVCICIYFIWFIQKQFVVYMKHEEL